MGPSENAVILKDDFDEISGKWNILKSNKSGRAIKFDTFSTRVIEGVKTTTMEVSKKSAIQVPKSVVTDQINSLLLQESGFSGVCTDENLMVIQSFGDTMPYLKNLNFIYNLNDLIPDNISVAFKAAAHKALKLNERVTLNKLLPEQKGAKKGSMFNILISPFYMDKSDERLLLILFTPVKTKAAEKNVINAGDINEVAKEHLISLEEEVAELKHNLAVTHGRVESANEEMQSYNEELQSANEEMQSANEEMQSSNEELQSVNEELQTVNKEHLMTIDELTDLNDDLNNYFRSNINGQLFVDRDLLLKRYSPAALKHINIRESDIGRPLSNITTNIKFETLIEDIKRVIKNEETITKEVESKDGKVYEVMTMPYLKKNSKKADGAIICFYGITEMKKLLHELDISNKSLSRINEDLNNFVYGASHDLNSPIHNIQIVFDMLADKMDLKDPEVLELSGMMHKAIRNFKEVINELAVIGHIESEIADENKLENLGEIFNEVKESISEQIKESKATFKADFRVKEIKFAKKNLRSIMLNLLTNAIKFRAPGRDPEITIKTEKAQNFIVLTLKDNGIGISKNRIGFIFEMYQRINEDIEGSGIGLYLLKKIIDASGGKIEVESEVGTGSTFKLFFKN